MFHRTQRLFLRPAFPEDWEAVLHGVGEEDIVRNLARAPWPYGEADAREFVALPQDQMLPHFLIVLPDEDGAPVIGSAGLGAPVDGCDGTDPEIGYWIARDRWGQGYASEAAQAVVDVAQALGHRRLSAGHFADNPASGAVLRNVGFEPTGRAVPRWSEARQADMPCVEFRMELTPMEAARQAA